MTSAPTAREPHAIAAVPARYHGVWVRTLLETPDRRDTTSWVRWLQTSRWHGDLRVPEGLDRSQASGLAQQLGFCGITEITPGDGARPEVCTWHRHHDFQPPRSTPDAGTMVFETPDRVIERGVFGNYLEVWERLPGSAGPCIALFRRDTDGGQATPELLLLAGAYLMHQRARTAAWPSDLRPDETLAALLERHGAASAALLDFDIGFGSLQASSWTIERSTVPAREGQTVACDLQRVNGATARIAQGPLAGDWQVLDWLDS